MYIVGLLYNTHLNSYSVPSDPLKIGPELTMDYTFKSNQVNLPLFDVKSTTTVTDTKVLYRKLLGG